MADKRISELTAASALTGTESVEVVQGGVNKKTTAQDIAYLAGGGTSIPFGTTSGTNTYTITATPTVTAYADGDLYLIEIGTSSTNASTLNFDGVGAKKAYERPNRQITAGDWETGRHYLVTYDSALDGGAGGFAVVGDLNHERLTYRGGYDVSSNLFPSTGGSGPSGGLRTGDFWGAVNSGTLGSTVVSNRDLIINVGGSSPGQTEGNWILTSGVASVDTKLALKANTTDIVGVQDLFFPADSFGPRVTNGCGPHETIEMATSLANLVVLPFDQTTQEYAQVRITPPRKWNGGTITVVPYWTATSGSGTVRWAINGGMYRNDDALTTAFGTAQNSDDTLTATNDIDIGPETSAITLSGTHADGAYVILQVSRDPANDTLNADALFVGLSVRFTTDAAKDA